MSTLYFVRHGETAWNRENRIQGCIDIDLNELGIIQAKAIAERLKNEKIEKIYSSELMRAYKTAEAVAEKFSIDVVRNKALNEIDFGSWEGLTFEELRNRDDYDYAQWRKSPQTASFPGEGTLKRVQERAISFINDILAENEGKNILVVSHGGVLKSIILGLLDMELKAYNKFYLANTSLSILEKEEDRIFLKTLNDTCHLRSLGDKNG